MRHHVIEIAKNRAMVQVFIRIFLCGCPGQWIGYKGFLVPIEQERLMSFLKSPPSTKTPGCYRIRARLQLNKCIHWYIHAYYIGNDQFFLQWFLIKEFLQ